MDANRRIEILSRQLCSASIGTADSAINSSKGPGLLDADSLQQICPKELAEVLIHDNPEIRTAVYELLKVCMGSVMHAADAVGWLPHSIPYVVAQQLPPGSRMGLVDIQQLSHSLLGALHRLIRQIRAFFWHQHIATQPNRS